MKIPDKRMLSILLALVMIMSLMPMVTISASAATGGRTQADAVAWANSQIGNALDYDGYYGAQCVDLTCYYYVYLGQAVPWGNAQDYVNGGSFTPSGWSYKSSPQPGDIAVDSSYYPGHVAIVVAVNGSQITIVEQQYNGQGYCTSRTCSSGLFNTFIHPDFPSGSSSVSVSFTPWTQDGYTYIRDTDASVGMNVQVSGGTPSFVGMILYNSSGTELARGGDYDSWVGIWYFKINEELHYTLTPGTTYKYKFYATVNGKNYWSDMQSFKTTGKTEYSISLNKTSLAMKVGETANLSATVLPAGTSVTWTSSNTSVATVSGGKVTAVAKGTATITAKAGDKSATCAVTVTEKATAPQIQTFEIAPATVEKEYFEMLSASGTAPITWTITSGALPSGMYLDEAGYISGMPAKAGNYSFTVSAKNSVGSATATFTLKVNEKPVQGVEVHFARITIYFQGQFIDVPADQWYTGNVATAYELGLMRGTSSNTFTPYGDVTIAEAITMASRIHSLYTTGTEHFDQSVGNAWYQTYLDYAYANGIISYAYYNCDVTHKASRAQFAEIFANSLPDEALAVISSVADGAIPDVSMGASYAPHVYKLYRAGILTGSDANGTFNPQTYITRSEAAAIVSRMAESNNRVRITLG